LNDSIKRAAVDDQVFDHRKRARAPGLDRYRLTVAEVSHVQLASSGGLKRPVRDSVDDHPARPADALPAIVIEGDRLFAALDQAFVHDVEHLEKRHVGRYVISLVLDKLPGRVAVLLAPNA
jgi:hypothetical protein